MKQTHDDADFFGHEDDAVNNAVDGHISDRLKKRLRALLILNQGKPAEQGTTLSELDDEAADCLLDDKETAAAVTLYLRHKSRATLGAFKQSGTAALRRLRLGKSLKKGDLRDAVVVTTAGIVWAPKSSKEQIDDAYHRYLAEWANKQHAHEGVKEDFQFVLKLDFNRLEDLCDDA